MLARDVMRDHQQESRMFGRRVLVTAIGGLILLGVLGARLTFLQIASHEHFSTLSHENRVRIQPVPPTRGLIYDRNGVLLADNLPSYQLQIVPEQVPDLEQTLSEVHDELLFSLESSGVEQFAPELNSTFCGQERLAEAVKAKATCAKPELKGCIAEIIKPGYQYVIDEQNVKIVRTARVKLYGSNNSPKA